MDPIQEVDRHQQVTKWGTRSLISCIVFGVWLMMAFVAQTDGETIVNNLQYWSASEIIIWAVVAHLSGITAFVSTKMLLQSERPPADDVEPWTPRELTGIACVVLLVAWVMVMACISV